MHQGRSRLSETARAPKLARFGHSLPSEPPQRWGARRPYTAFLAAFLEAFFFAFLAGAFLAVAFLADAFFFAAFLAGAFLAVAFLAGAFLAAFFLDFFAAMILFLPERMAGRTRNMSSTPRVCCKTYIAT